MSWPLSQQKARRRRWQSTKEGTKDLVEAGGAPPADFDGDPRSVAESDRDKLIYSFFLRRLAGVTQVVGAREGHVFHNRLTHTLKVAQLAQRLAERFLKLEEFKDLAEKLSIDPSVAEAAALAHDLGHPPYGHVAEQALCECVDSYYQPGDEDAAAGSDTAHGESRKRQNRSKTPKPKYANNAEDGESGVGESESNTVVSDGFEGNAQSFRILTRLGVHKPDIEGLNLSRATLNGVLKYPFLRDPKKVGTEHEKWGAYRADQTDFRFARGDLEKDQQTVEAAIMDVADDIAYSVHDLDDFVRAGLIPLADLLYDDGAEIPGSERSRFEAWWKQSQFVDDPHKADEKLDTLFDELRDLYGHQVYRGEYQQRGLARKITSRWIGEMLEAIHLVDPEDNEGQFIRIEPFEDLQIKFLKGLVWHYVIESQKLATQRRGQQKIIQGLFDIYLKAACDRGGETRALFPNRFLQELHAADKGEGRKQPSNDELRLAADVVASFTDREASKMYYRLTGVSLGSVTEVIEV